MLRVMVSLDLKDVDTAVRNDFNAFLAEANWSKMGSVDTVWSVYYENQDQSQHDQTKGFIINKLMQAAKILKLKEISVVAQVGNARAIGHKITLKSGVHTGVDFNPYP